MAHLGQWLLIALLVVPLAGAVTLGFIRHSRACWWVGLSFLLLAFVLALLLNFPSGEDITFVRVHLRADGLSRPFLLLATALYAVLFLVSGKSQTRPLTFAVKLLLADFAGIGVFIAFNALLLALFLAAVVVAFSILARMGQPGEKSATAFPVYLSLGLYCVLGSMIAAGPVAGTFDLAALTMTPRTSSPLLFMLCVAGCCFWLAIVPLHSWMDQVLTRASTPAAIVAGVLAPAIGGYALFRLAGPLYPQAYQLLWAPLAMLGIASILYGGLCALAQPDLKPFVAFSTTSIGGFILLAFAIRTPVAATGAVILLVGQGLVVTLLLYSSEVPAEGSGALAAVAWIGWLVVPVLLGQFLVLLGVFQAARTLLPGYGLAVAASFGPLLSGAGAARIHYRRLFPHL